MTSLTRARATTVRRLVPLARRQMLHEPLKLALVGVTLALALVGP